MRKIIKRSVVVLLAGVLLFSLSGCKKKQKKDEVQRYAWPLGTSSPEDTVTQLYAEKFAKEVSRLSHGKMKIEVYPNSTLGGDRELLESCKDGEYVVDWNMWNTFKSHYPQYCAPTTLTLKV